MTKSLLVASLLVAAVGCAGSTEPSSSAADAITGTAALSLDAAKAQVAAVRAKYEPTGAHELLFDASLAPAYLADVKPIFAQVASTDRLPLGADAFTYVSTEIQAGAVFGKGFFDAAVAASYSDLVDFSSYYGNGLSTRAEFWTVENGLIARSKVGSLSDLQVLELAASVTQPSTFRTGLDALGWAKAPEATAAQAKLLVDASRTFAAVTDLLFGQLVVVPDGTAHDVDASDAFGVRLLTRTFSKARLLGNDEGTSVAYELGEHLSEAKIDLGHDATVGLGIAKSTLTAPEMETLSHAL